MGVLLVSAQKIKAFTNLNESIDEALLTANIQIASDLGLQSLLGSLFYNYILDGAQNNTLNSVEVNLLQNYIQPYLIHRAYWECIPNIWMRAMNKSIIVGNTEQGTAVSAGDMKYLRNITQDRFEFYAQRLMDEIINHPGNYPLYFQYTSTDGMPPERENYFGGIHISNAQPRHISPVAPYRYPFDSIYYGCNY